MGVKAVQALSRLNRGRPGKSEPVVLDFHNDPAVIEAAFFDFCRATILSGETDPNKLHDLKRALYDTGVCAGEDIETVIPLYLVAASRDRLDPVLDACSVRYEALIEDEQIAFEGAEGLRARLCVSDELRGSLADHTDLYALYNTDKAFKAWLQERLFAAAKDRRAAAAGATGLASAP